MLSHQVPVTLVQRLPVHPWNEVGCPVQVVAGGPADRATLDVQPLVELRAGVACSKTA